MLLIAAVLSLGGCSGEEVSNPTSGSGVQPIISEGGVAGGDSDTSSGNQSGGSAGSEGSSSTTTYSGTVVGDLTILPYNIVLNDSFPIRFIVSSSNQVTVYVDDISPVTVSLVGSGFTFSVSQSFAGIGSATCSSTVNGSGTLSGDQITGSVNGSPTCTDGLTGTVSGSYTATRS